MDRMLMGIGARGACGVGWRRLDGDCRLGGSNSRGLLLSLNRVLQRWPDRSGQHGSFGHTVAETDAQFLDDAGFWRRDVHRGFFGFKGDQRRVGFNTVNLDAEFGMTDEAETADVRDFDSLLLDS